MDMGLVILAGVVMLAAVIILFFAFRGGRTEADANRHIAELAGRLSQMASAQATNLAQMTERMQSQERILSKVLEERLDNVTTRVSETLEKTSVAQSITLGELRERIAKIDAAQANINELSGQVTTLQQIFSNKQARGTFGEQQLQDLVEGALPPSAYEFQAPLGDGKRVDCLLKLPNPPGSIAIDSKFPLESFRALRDAGDEVGRTNAARQFRIDMLKHIKDISEKYIIPGQTADSALLFLPSEAVYAELYTNFDDVVQLSFRARVFIVSPTTLWANLNTMRAIFRDVRMRELAGTIQKEVHLLADDIKRLDNRVNKLQTHFAQANEDVREIGISTAKVIKRSLSINELDFDEPGAVEATAEQAPRLPLSGQPGDVDGL